METCVGEICLCSRGQCLFGKFPKKSFILYWYHTVGVKVKDMNCIKSSLIVTNFQFCALGPNIMIPYTLYFQVRDKRKLYCANGTVWPRSCQSLNNLIIWSDSFRLKLILKAVWNVSHLAVEIQHLIFCDTGGESCFS